MVFKLNISDKGKAWKVELADESLSGKSIGEKFDGKEIKPELEGYQLEITGGSDSAGFPMYKELEGSSLKRFLFKKGWGMKDNRKGVRIRKTVRGKSVFANTSQINIKVVKAGSKPLAEIFAEQNKVEVKAEKKEAPKAAAK